MTDETNKVTYAESGVDVDRVGRALKKMLFWINQTEENRPGLGRSCLPIGHFAAVVDIGNGMGLALSTDSVGTKVLIAQMMDKYDTIAIDCIAMNVNDVICVGAEPICMLDYLAVEQADEFLLEEIAKGLHEGCRQARISIPGGEIAQIGDVLQGAREGRAFDLVGSAMALVPLDKMVLGNTVVPGDVVVGIRSSGLHSNGFSLARRVLLGEGGPGLEHYSEDLGRTVGEEMLEPTRIYVREVVDMVQAGVPVKGLVNITGDGFLNLHRLDSPVGYHLTDLPEPHPIFRVIQDTGKVAVEEMFLTFNMGIGFCVVCPEDAVDAVVEMCAKYEAEAMVIGRTTDDPEKKVVLEDAGLVGKGPKFVRR